MSVWFRNKKTDCVWEISDENLIKRLLNDNTFTEVTEQHEKQEVVEPIKAEVEQTVPKKTGRPRKQNGTINN